MLARITATPSRLAMHYFLCFSGAFASPSQPKGSRGWVVALSFIVSPRSTEVSALQGSNEPRESQDTIGRKKFLLVGTKPPRLTECDGQSRSFGTPYRGSLRI